MFIPGSFNSVERLLQCRGWVSPGSFQMPMDVIPGVEAVAQHEFNCYTVVPRWADVWLRSQPKTATSFGHSDGAKVCQHTGLCSH